jgi:hypothetical protein
VSQDGDFFPKGEVRGGVAHASKDLLGGGEEAR